MLTSKISSLVSGSKSHKSITKEKSWILWSYYNNNKTLFFFCFGNELFFVALYVMNSYHVPIGLSHTLQRFSPEFLHLLPAEVHKFLITMTWPQFAAIVTFPIMFTKQIINCVQFWKASKVLVESDQEERYEKLHNKEK